MPEEFEVVSRIGERLACTLFVPDTLPPWSCAVLFHGFGSKRLNEINSALAPQLTSDGVAVVVGDLSGHGDSSGTIATQNVLRGAEEIQAIMRHVVEDGRVDAEHVAVLGNSFSGAASIIAAPNLNIVGLALKAPACDYEHIRREQLGDDGMFKWETTGTALVTPGVEADWSSIDVARTVDVYKAFANLTVPVCVWQGTADEVIPESDWLQLEALCEGGDRQFKRIEGADHRIAGAHLEPFLADVKTFLLDTLDTSRLGQMTQQAEPAPAGRAGVVEASGKRA